MQFEQVMGLTVKSGGKGEKEFIGEIKEGLIDSVCKVAG